MKRLLFALCALCVSLCVLAQDEVFRKYTEMGDVNTTYVSRGMLEQVPLDQFNIPGLADIARRIDNMTILVSRGDKAGKEMGNKLPSQLMRRGFEEKLNTKRDGTTVRILQSKRDPSNVVMVFYQKPHASVVRLKGDFSGGLEGLVPPAEE